MNAFIHHFTFEFRTGIRNKNLLLLYYLFPIGFYLMMGLIMVDINPLFRDVLIPAMITFTILSATLLGLPDPLVSARESGIFRSYKINGIPALAILAIPALTTLLHVTIVSLLITFTAPWFFDAPAPVNWPAFLLISLVMACASISIGLLIGVIAPSTRMTVLYAQAIYLPSMLLGGLMMPLSMLPEGAGVAARLLPATHAMNAYNALAMGGAATFSAWGSIAAMTVSGVLAFILARVLFRWGSSNRSPRPVVLALLAWVPFLVMMVFS